MIKKKIKKNVEGYQSICKRIGVAELTYRSMLKNLFSDKEFDEIDTLANHRTLSLHEAAREWLREYWK